MCLKNNDFLAYFKRKLRTILFINPTFFKLGTQNFDVRSTTKTVSQKLPGLELLLYD